MTKQDLVERMQQGQAWVPGKKVKIDFGGDQGAIMLDGAAQQVSDIPSDADAADTTIRGSTVVTLPPAADTAYKRLSMNAEASRRSACRNSSSA